MSFNSIQGQQQIQASNQPFTLREGQVFHGTIKQLYPDQMAEVQVGNNKFVAKLEVPLKAGDAHFFQVTNTSGQAEIKVVTGPMAQATPQQQLQQLMQSMNLPKSAEMQQVLGHFVKNEIPISREQLMSAETWMKNLPEGVAKQEALIALGRMVELKMPFNQMVFHSLLMGGKTDGMSTNLQQFIEQLSTSNVQDSVKNSLMNQLQNITKPLNAEVGGNMLAKAMETLQNPNTANTMKEQMLSLLKNANILSKNATVQNWQTAIGSTQVQASLNNSSQGTMLAGSFIAQVASTKLEQVPQMIQQVSQFIQNDRLLTNEQKGQLQQLVARFSQLPMTQQTIALFAKQLGQQLTSAYSQNQQSQPFNVNEQGVSTKEQLLSLIKPEANVTQLDTLLRGLVKESQASLQPQIQAQLTQSEAQVQSAVDSKAMEQAMKTVLKGLGLNYEAQLANKGADIQQLAQSLKPQLMALIQDAQTPSALRDSTEVLLARMNGMSLLSGENGHQHQLVMQVPLEFFGKKMDATLQWNGRMKDDGKIDSDYARVLFYLTMESMQETVIDMQVQNRIVTLTVFNDDAKIAALATPLKEALRIGLAQKEYQLSGVFIKQFNEPKTQVNETVEDNDVPGVDIRV